MQTSFTENSQNIIKEAAFRYAMNLTDETSFYEYCINQNTATNSGENNLIIHFVIAQTSVNPKVGLQTLAHLMLLSVSGHFSKVVIDMTVKLLIDHYQSLTSDSTCNTILESVLNLNERYESLLQFEQDPKLVEDEQMRSDLEDQDHLEFLTCGI